MKLNARLYHCARCHCQVIICSLCDRGNIYCCACARLARRQSLRAAGQRYQNTHQGKLKHAARQRCYRQRQKEKVTHQGSLNSSDEFSLNPQCNEPQPPIKITRLQVICCDFCKKPCCELLRIGFLRDHSTKSTVTSWPFGP